MAQIFTAFPHQVTGITGGEHSAQLLRVSEIAPTLRVPVSLRFIRFRPNTQFIYTGRIHADF